MRASRNSSWGRPSRTLSCLSVLWPINTASPSERCRSKCSLSSRDVKSTGEKARVVIFPSTVIAKVAMTKGRDGMWEPRTLSGRRGFFRDTEVTPAFLFCFADFMLESRDFLFHLTQGNMRRRAARFVEEVNDAARCAAKEDDEKTQRTDEHRFAFLYAAQSVQHDLQYFLAEPDAGETDRHRRDRALDRHNRKKIHNLYVRAQRVSNTEERREGREMGDE